MTFVVAAAQALECAIELRMRVGDSPGDTIEPSGPMRSPFMPGIARQKKNKSQYRLFFSWLSPLAK
ncbi:hypothetical protein [Mesorhizobium australicum]|uniref:hypothetical protein n=1 Tax=Mesorhizobium australicum TaxID=536018 RepID=UPI00333CE56E